jgi:hypothetical protein
VGQAGDPRSLGTAAAPRRDARAAGRAARAPRGDARLARRVARSPGYVYRLADLDDLFSEAQSRADPDIELRRDAMNRRTNWRVAAIVVVVAIGIGVVAAGMVNQAVSIVMNLFAS